MQIIRLLSLLITLIFYLFLDTCVFVFLMFETNACVLWIKKSLLSLK